MLLLAFPHCGNSISLSPCDSFCQIGVSRCDFRLLRIEVIEIVLVSLLECKCVPKKLFGVDLTSP